MDYTVHGILQARILEWVARFLEETTIRGERILMVGGRKRLEIAEGSNQNRRMMWYSYGQREQFMEARKNKNTLVIPLLFCFFPNILLLKTSNTNYNWSNFTLSIHIPTTCSLSLEEGMATHSSILAWRIPMDREAWWTSVHRVAKSRTWLSDWVHVVYH